jgi:hypothetical protein
MSKDPEGLILWKTLREQWHRANQNAREARTRLTATYASALTSGGPAPTQMLIDDVLWHEKLADTLSVELNQFVVNRLG